MAYFNLTATGSALTFAGTTLTCLQTVQFTGNAEIQEISCNGTTTKTKITGATSYVLTLTGALDEDDVTLLNAINPGDAGAVAADLAGTTTGTIDISSTNGTVSDWTVDAPVNGFATYSATIQLDDLTVAANA